MILLCKGTSAPLLKCQGINAPAIPPILRRADTNIKF